MASSALRDLPGIDRLLREPAVERLIRRHARGPVLAAARELVADWRERLRLGEDEPGPDLARLVGDLETRLARVDRPALRPVLNATGVIVHTNLGRAPLSEAALAAAQAIGRGYANLEYELGAGQRGSRHELVAEALRALTGAEAALVVNNNAAAILLALSVVAVGREVIISRGQLVEIGGGFRIPDVLTQSGARLIEVGTTNRTYLEDYRRAIGPETAALLRVHSSNFRVVGFVHETGLEELAGLARAHGLVLIDDLGSGSLLDSSAYGLQREPMVQESVAAGADLVTFSGDKLLGGPQAGIIVGRAELIGKLKRHPLTRAVRPDKVTLAALGATLGHYQRGEAVERVPVWRMIAAGVDELDTRGRRLGATLTGARCRWEVMAGRSAVGGGSLPGETLPSRLLAIDPATSPDALAARLRAGDPPVVGRIERDRLLLDLRTVLPEDDATLARCLQVALDEPADGEPDRADLG